MHDVQMEISADMPSLPTETVTPPAYALSEAYAMTRIPMIREPMEKSVQVIIKGQRAGGFDIQIEFL